MPGFVTIVSNSINFNKINLNYRSLKEFKLDEITINKTYIARYTNKKFLDDKMFEETNDFFIVIEGVIFNKKDLMNSFASSSYLDLIHKLYDNYGETFFKYFKGEFSGMLYDKINGKYIIFTNETGSKPIFYYNFNSTYIFSSELKVITDILKFNNIDFNLDEIGAYFLLTYGYMLEDYTLIRQVKKLQAGNYIVLDKDKMKIHSYNTIKNQPYNSESYEKTIGKLDELFKYAVKTQYEKDDEYQYKHISSLSGGLDSRMEVMIAHELGYSNCLNLTFGQNGCLDEIVAKAISSDINNEFVFYSLDNGNYLMDIDEMLICNDGLILYSGAAHVLSALKNINFEDYGIYHTGQVGDAVLGSFINNVNINNKSKIGDGAYSYRLLDRISDVVYNIQYKYNDEEIFKFYNRAFNGAINGDWVANQFTEFSSPFLYKDFFDYALKIPREYKYEERIYIDWINKLHPNIGNYKWEKIGIRPTNSLIKVKLYNKIIRRIFFKNRIESMNPFDYWYNNNHNLKKFLYSYINKNMYLLDSYNQLKKDCISLCDYGTFFEKTQVMTLLGALRLHFN
ncbi:asparagine synthase [Clostridium fermenticellae]|uniref:asparagine synthase (glutamine-hydrolyzing) n=1 Tax=Clostridium fermenticellae TaxID=2068654 RepID=A0A386H115_9CLOT|nr:asparagine synthase [Clostridium fermenticellae]AYD39338.1 asparagine synthase [Clostridium fermenticellae]